MNIALSTIPFLLLAMNLETVSGKVFLAALTCIVTSLIAIVIKYIQQKIKVYHERRVKEREEKTARRDAEFVQQITKIIEDKNQKQSEILHAEINKISNTVTDRMDLFEGGAVELFDEMDQKFEDMDKKVDNLTDELTVVKAGLLDVQGMHFKNKCKEILDDEISLTNDLFLQLNDEYTNYKRLGGNHDGDFLWDQVQKVYDIQLANK